MVKLGSKQWIMIGATVVVAGLLFSLPKVVVKDEKEEQESKGKQTEVIAEAEKTADVPSNDVQAVDTLHAQKLTEEKASLVTKLKVKVINSSTAKVEKAKALEEISTVFRNNGNFDSAAVYLEKRATILATPQAYEAAGEAYFEAFTLAIKEEKRDAMLTKSRAMLSKSDAGENNLNAKVKLALTFVEGPEPMKGISMLREVLQKDPNNELALYNLGQFSIRTQQYDKAIGRFEQLVKINPKDSRYWFYLGETQKQMGKKKEAIDSFKKVKQLNPDPTAIATVDGYLKELGQ